MSQTENAAADRVLAHMAATLRELIGEEWVADVDITRATSFARDLELESIEFVALAERLTDEYGARVDFAAWLGDMELEQILGLTVGEVVDFICRCLSSSETV
jgi:acyl carrier protein